MLEQNRKSQRENLAMSTRIENKENRGREKRLRRRLRNGEKKMQSQRGQEHELQEVRSRAKGTCNWTTKGTSSPRRQRALPRDARQGRGAALRGGATYTRNVRRGAVCVCVCVPLSNGGELAPSTADRQRRESRGVRVEPRHDTEDLREPRRRLGAFLKRAERRGRRRDDGEGIG